MSIFKPSKQEISERAEQLISEQFRLTCSRYPYDDNITPSTMFARKVIREAMEKEDIKDMIARALKDAAIDVTVEKYIRKEVRAAIIKLVGEDMITDIVSKINAVQVK